MHRAKYTPPVEPLPFNRNVEITMSDETLSGTIKKLREGYGFITGADGKDYFLHWTSLAKESPKDFRQLEVGDRVEFKWKLAEKGPRALDVMVLA